MKRMMLSIVVLLSGFVIEASGQQFVTGCRTNTFITNYPDVQVSFITEELSPRDCVSNQSGIQTCKTVAVYSLWDGEDECSVQVGHFTDMTDSQQARVVGWCKINGQVTQQTLGHLFLEDFVDIAVVNNNGNLRFRAQFVNASGHSVNKPWPTPFNITQVTKVGVEMRASLGVFPQSRFEPFIDLSSFVLHQWSKFVNHPNENPYGNINGCDAIIVTQGDIP